METMYNRRTTEIVDVYKIDMDKKIALCFNRRQAMKQNGVGWQLINLNHLVPVSQTEVIDMLKEEK